MVCTSPTTATYYPNSSCCWTYSPGGITPIGYRIAKKMVGGKIRNIYEIDEAYAPVIIRVFQMYLSGIGAKQIAMTLNNEGVLTQKGKKWSNLRILDMLANPVYSGVLVWGKTTRDYYGKAIYSNPEGIIRTENAHPAIIDDVTFARVKERLASCNPMNKPRIIEPRGVQSDYILSGFMRCQCGSSLSGTKAKSGKYTYYSCVTQAKMGKEECDLRPIPQHILENIVINFLKTELLAEDKIQMFLKQLKDEQNGGNKNIKDKLKNVEHDLSVERKKLERIYEQIEEGNLSGNDISERIRTRKSRINELEIMRCQYQAEIKNPPSYEMSLADIRSYIIRCKLILAEASTGEKKEFLRSLIQSIILKWNGKEWEASSSLLNKRTFCPDRSLIFCKCAHSEYP